MDIVTIMFAIGLPVLGIGGAIAAWRIQKRQDQRETETKWRDDSLDEWRKDREAKAEAERAERTSRPELEAGSTEEREEARRQQRIGG